MSFSELNYKHGVQFVDIDPQGEALVEFVEYAPLRGLVTIPAKGRAVSAEALFDCINSLPKRDKKNTDSLTWPYLEIHVEEAQPQPTLMHDVMEALQDRAVHFCRMLRVRPENKKADSANDVDTPSADTLANINPLELARRNFEARFNSEMPEELVTRFKQAEAETKNNMNA